MSEGGREGGRERGSEGGREGGGGEHYYISNKVGLEEYTLPKNWLV